MLPRGAGYTCQEMQVAFIGGRRAYLFAGRIDLIHIQGREVLLNRRARACSIVHKDLQSCELVIIVRPVIAAEWVPPTRL